MDRCRYDVDIVSTCLVRHVLIFTASAQLPEGQLLNMRLSIRKPAPKAQVSFWQRLDSKKRSKVAQSAAIAVADR